MNKHNVISIQDREQPADGLTELLRSGAKRLIYQAVEAELTEFL